MTMEEQISAAGNKEMAGAYGQLERSQKSLMRADRLATLRICVATYLITAGKDLEVNTVVEAAFASCASEDASVQDFVRRKTRNSAEGLAVLSDYRAALKQDMIKRIVAARG